MIKALLSLLLVAALCSACTAVSVRKAPTIDVHRFHRIFVVQPFNENHHIDELFVDELRRNGFFASSGPMTMMPENTDAVLVYQAQWTGDFTTSLLDLSLELFTAHTNKKLAEARYYQPSARPKRPERVVDELVKRLTAK